MRRSLEKRGVRLGHGACCRGQESREGRAYLRAICEVNAALEGRRASGGRRIRRLVVPSMCFRIGGAGVLAGRRIFFVKKRSLEGRSSTQVRDAGVLTQKRPPHKFTCGLRQPFVFRQTFIFFAIESDFEFTMRRISR